MKKVNIFLTILFLTAGCGGNRQSGIGSDGLITVDVTKNYPKKELILQDFMEVEYIALETGGEFYTQGSVRAIGKEIILIMNRIDDGDIFVFDRNGAGLRKINRMGRGGEEYLSVMGIVLDEDNEEMFVHDYNGQKIMVYDLFGNFKRRINNVEGIRYDEIYNFDEESLICSEIYLELDGATTDNPPFFIISKQDGSIVKDIQIPFEKKKSTIMMHIIDNSINMVTVSCIPIIPHNNSWILTEVSTDTIYRILEDYSMSPFISRTPSIQSMNPEVFLLPSILTDRYYFMHTVKNEFDFSTNRGLSRTHLVYDRQEKTIYEYTVHNDDYSDKRVVDMVRESINSEIAFWQRIEADDLVEDYENGVLTGRLKEIAADLEEESNPVIMLVKYKK